MRRISTAALLGALCIGAIAGVPALTSVSAQPTNDTEATPPTTTLSGEQKLTDDQADMKSAREKGEPLPVMNPETGERSGGYVLPRDLDVQNDRVDERLSELGLLDSNDKRVMDVAMALMTVEAVPVRDGKGSTVGYFGSRFIPVDQYESAASAAEATIQQLMKAS